MIRRSKRYSTIFVNFGLFAATVTIVSHRDLLAQTVTINPWVSQGAGPDMASAPPVKISVKDFKSPLVTVIAPGSPDFNQQLPSGITGPMQALLPFSLLIKNNGAQSIIGLTVVWRSLSRSGEPYTNFLGMIDYASLKPFAVPGNTGLATIFGRFDSLAVNPRLPDLVAAQVATFQNQASVSITLEAVVFQDGTFIGSDTLQTVAEMKGRIRAEHDLFQATVEKIASGASGLDVTEWLQKVAAEFPPGSRVNLTNDAFSAWYAYYYARLAGGLVNSLQAHDLQTLLGSLRSMLRTKPYPAGFVN